MESLPPRQASQRRAAPEQTPPGQQSQPRTTPSPSLVRTRSEDSHTLFLNSANEEQQAQPEAQEDQKHPPPQQAAPASTANADDDAVKKCWICFSDSTEDTPDTSPWRDPCPCALVAHEECLLDWIADMEAPNNPRSQQGLSGPKIECPQCKSEICVARPRDVVVEAVRGVEKAAAHLVTPGALSLLAGAVYGTTMWSGAHSIYTVFGSEDAERILHPLTGSSVARTVDLNNASLRDVGEGLYEFALHHLVHWRVYVGVPLITPMLLLSRTKLADSVLPVLPILFFVTQNHSPNEPLDFAHWPPSASLAFSLLPYLRVAYNHFYEKAFAAKERQWLKELQPRAREGQVEDAINADPEPVARDRDDGNVFEVRIDGGIWDDWEEEDSEDEGEEGDAHQHHLVPIADPAPPMHVEGNPADPPPNIADNRQQAPAGQGNQNAANHPHQHQNRHQAAAGQRRLSFSPTAIAETVLSTLAFPTIAGISGELLKLALPRSWTTGKGLLHQKWGRSLVGGCLVVVLRDVVMLYARWKMVRMHRKRRIVDYEGRSKSAAAAE